ncbi:hypothetical protein ACLOJK_029767 [Asimina triloba]
MAVDEKDFGQGIYTWIFQIWLVAYSHKNRALPILPSDSRWVLIGDGGDDAWPATGEMQWTLPRRSSPFLALLRRRSSCRIIRPLPSFWMVQIHHLPELVGITGRASSQMETVEHR